MTQASASSARPDLSLDTTRQTSEAIDRFRADFSRVREQVARVIVGHEDVVNSVLICLFCRGHLLLEGVPGLGKTLLVRSLAKALKLDFSRVQFTPDLMPADITGTTVVREVSNAASGAAAGNTGTGGMGGAGAGGGGGGTSREFVFERGPIFGQIILADEINRATPKTQSALLEAMQERSVTVAGISHPLPKPFLVMATQNPLEQEGTYPLPEAQLDRFFFKLLVGYSSRQELSRILDRTTAGHEEAIEPVLDAQSILAHQALVERCAIPPSVQDYAVRIVLATHPRRDKADAATAGGASGQPAGSYFATPMTNRFVRVGASPRAAQALVLGAKCRALVNGRAAVAVEDLQAVALPALRHRLILNFEASAEGVTPDAVVENILSTLPRVAD